jgi:peptide/nickel transport system permease protein
VLKVLLKRLVMLLIVVWAAATVVFILPRLNPDRDPIREKLGQLAASGGLRQEGIEEMVRAYQAKFGRDKPLLVQYGRHLWDMCRMDFGPSLSLYPSRVNDLIANALPWTLGLLLAATLIAFLLGNLLGALVAWPGTPRWCRVLVTPLMALSSVPFYLLGLILVYVFGLALRWLPLAGGYTPGVLATPSWGFAMDVVRHSVLPALSIVLASIGFWALGMRGMMVSTVDEAYMTLGRANGLRSSTLFFRYAVRNAVLPQVTALGLALGHLVTGQVVVEVVFQYPGIGSLLFGAIKASDYSLISGIVFMTIVTIGVTTLILDLVYPLLDPRIRRQAET